MSLYWLLLIIPFLILYLLLIIRLFFKRKGILGEHQVKKNISKTINEQQYVINNFLVRLSNNKSMQVDHIIINKNGVFVIEVKDFRGKIVYDINKQEWQQILINRFYKRNRFSVSNSIHKFYSPIKQNQTHIYELSKIINNSDVRCYKNVVLFGNKSEIKTFNKCNIYVAHIDEVNTIINSRHDDILSKDTMKFIYDKLVQYQQQNQISLYQHIRYANFIQKKYGDSVII